MRIKQLITELEQMLDAHGDLEIFTSSDAGCGVEVALGIEIVTDNSAGYYPGAYCDLSELPEKFLKIIS